MATLYMGGQPRKGNLMYMYIYTYSEDRKGLWKATSGFTPSMDRWLIGVNFHHDAVYYTPI